MKKYQFKPFAPVFRITNLINVSYHDLPENFTYPEESHDFWELSYVDRGSIVEQQEGESYLVKAGEMLLCKPNAPHSCQAWQNSRASVVDVEFSLAGSLPENFESRILILSEEEKHCMETIVREASETYADFDSALPAAASLEKLPTAPFGSEQILCNRLEELLIYACRSDRNVQKSCRLLSADPTGDSGQLSEWVRAYIQSHYGRKLTLDQIADAHAVSVTQLKRVFRQQTGQTVMAYLSGVRIREAKRLLREGVCSISQIAEQTGFGDVHYFSAVFKKQTGMTATEYAKSVHRL